MVDATKITLSREELLLVCNTDWILMKRIIIDKVYALFGKLSSDYMMQIKKEGSLAQRITIQPKISRGENYLHLPYVVMDYPRQYDMTDTLAVRTMFWWGNFFSITLHVTGKNKEIVAKNIMRCLPALQAQALFICNSSEQWHHHFEKDNYVSLGERSSEDIAGMIEQKDFIKIAAKFPLQQWQTIPLALQDIFGKMLELLKH